MKDDFELAEKALEELIGEQITVCPIAGASLPDLVAVDEACFDANICYGQEEFEEELAHHTTFGLLLYNSRGAMCGYVLAYADEKNGRLPFSGAYISSIAVVPGYQRKGIFKTIFPFFESICRARGYTYARLHTRSRDNPRYTGSAEAFRKQGFRVVSRCYERDGDNQYIMIKPLVTHADPITQP